MIEELKSRIDESLAEFLEKIRVEYKLHLVNPILYNSIKEFCLREGKRIRPLLLLLSYIGYSPKNKKITKAIYHASTCIELLHNFMLIHDDIIDRSDLRRGKPTLHRLLRHAVKTDNPEKLGSDLSIIAGDIVYAFAIDAFLCIAEPSERKERALKYFIQTAAFTAMGEFIDTLHGFEPLQKVSEKDVYLNYTLKTARYTFDCPLVTGAILAGADNREIKKLSDFGIMIGQAFQIQDDIIGIFDSEKNIGKSVLSDLDESKKTLLVCHTYRTLSTKKRKDFVRIFTKPKKTYEDLLTVRKIFVESGSLLYSLEAIQSRLNKSLKILQGLKMKPEFRALIGASLSKLFLHSQTMADQNNVKISLNAHSNSLP